MHIKKHDKCIEPFQENDWGTLFALSLNTKVSAQIIDWYLGALIRITIVKTVEETTTD